MSFEWFVAKRYLRSPNRPAVLRLVTAFSVIGVAAGVATLVIALAMNTGFRETLQDRLLGVTAHISLTHPGDSGGIRNYAALADKLLETRVRATLVEHIGSSEMAAITLSAANGKIILAGTTSNGALPAMAAKLAREIEDVNDVDNRIVSVPSHGRF